MGISNNVSFAGNSETGMENPCMRLLRRSQRSQKRLGAGFLDGELTISSTWTLE